MTKKPTENPSDLTMDLNQAEEIMKKTMSDLFRHGVRSIALLESDDALMVSYIGICDEALTDFLIYIRTERPLAFKAALEQIEKAIEEADRELEAEEAEEAEAKQTTH